MLGGRLRLSPNNPRHSAQLPSYTETRRCDAGESVSALAVTCKAATYDSISAFRPRGWRESGVQGGARGGLEAGEVGGGGLWVDTGGRRRHRPPAHHPPHKPPLHCLTVHCNRINFKFTHITVAKCTEL